MVVSNRTQAAENGARALGFDPDTYSHKIYIYPSHDVDAGIPDDDLGNQYAMHDYRVLSMDRVGGPVTVHPVAIDVKNIPWASKQSWAPCPETPTCR